MRVHDAHRADMFAGNKLTLCTSKPYPPAPGTYEQAPEIAPERSEQEKRRGRARLPFAGFRLVAVLLNARRAQAGQSVFVDGGLPGQKFLGGELVALAGFFKAE